MEILGGLQNGLIFVMSAPAGTGKTTLVQMLCQEFACVAPSISYTTRPPRVNEVPGKDYHFISVREFKEKIKSGEFIEHACVFGHYYGTSKKYIRQLQKLGKHVVLVIDTQGAMEVKKTLQATFIFVSPPSMEVLRQRLIARKTDDEQSIETRLHWANEEMKFAPLYDYQIVNDKLSNAYEVLRSILIAEEHRIRHT